MLIVRVHAHIKPDSVSNFRRATIRTSGNHPPLDQHHPGHTRLRPRSLLIQITCE